MTDRIFKRGAALMAVLITVIMAFAALTTFVGCGKPKATIAGINKNTATVEAGGTVTLTVDIEGELAEDEKVVWESSNTAVATVADGKVKGVTGGTAEITATLNETSAKCVVTVTDKYEFSIDTENATIYLDSTDKTVNIHANAVKNGTADAGAEISWASEDETVATVSGGVVTALKAGSTVITASYQGQNKTCTVKVVEFTDVGTQTDAMDASKWYRFESDTTGAVPVAKEGKVEITAATRLDLFKVRVNPEDENSAWVSPVDNVNNFDKEGGAKFYGYEYLFELGLTATKDFNLILFATKTLPVEHNNSHRGIYLYFTDGKIELKQSGVGGDAVQATAEYTGKVTDITSVSFSVTRLSNTEILLKLFVNGSKVELTGSPANGSISDGGYFDNYSVNQSNGYGPRFCVVPGEATVTISSSTVKRSTTK